MRKVTGKWRKGHAPKTITFTLYLIKLGRLVTIADNIQYINYLTLYRRSADRFI